MSPTRSLAVLLSAGLALVACGGDTSNDTSESTSTTNTASGGGTTLTLYSGRGEDLVQPVIDMFTETTGIDVDVRYGNSAEMLLLIQEEGDNSPADVYYSQGAGFLGTLSADGRLLELDDDIPSLLIDPALASPSGDWIGLTGRARTVVYNTETLSADDLPNSFADFTDPTWKGRIGWAPTNASLQDHITALRYILGEDGARAWLEGIMANDPIAYEGNGAILDGVAAGEVEVGFVNHYYLYQNLVEDPDFPVANRFYTDGDPGALVNIAGAGVLTTSDHPTAAQDLLRYLLSEPAQAYFADANYELPVVAGVPTQQGLPELGSLTLPAFDLNLLLDLQGTVDLLIDVGAL
ncbi:MAG: iron ABC transporter substrate-binding protein [Actinomycetota bacterium]|jgi:iron(III) transport system substrate-binding protein|nr:iron ABC transporter substrate-binding protein [Actinomycetota bacterium]MDA3028696.1 iron ABC transporter substrate-binding protein [Actinomycetota bacterium]